MSVAAEKFAWRKRNLKPSYKYVLLAICKHHEARTGYCSPSIKQLSNDTAMCVNTVRANLEALSQLEIITITRPPNFGKRYQYQLNGFDPNERAGLKKPTAAQRLKAEANPKLAKDHGELFNIQFDTIWELYPRKRSKISAQRAYSAMMATQKQYNKIVEDIKVRTMSEWSNIEPKWIPHLATYLKDEKFNDEPDIDKRKMKTEGANEYKKGL